MAFCAAKGGGILDDLTVARLDEGEFLLVVNAARRQTDEAWLRCHLPPHLTLHDRTKF